VHLKNERDVEEPSFPVIEDFGMLDSAPGELLPVEERSNGQEECTPRMSGRLQTSGIKK